MKRFSIAMVIVGLLGATPSGAAETWRATGFETPESVLFDAAHHHLIVSNINGSPGTADGNGYLSLLSMDGKVIARKWATGMDAPKGMAIAGNRLYVSDITRLRVVDLETGMLVATVPMEDAVFLNDVTAFPSGDVYVTDMLANAIYRYRDGKAELWLKDDALRSPNGILAMGDHLVVGAWGQGMKKDFSTEKPGGLLSVNLKTKAITPLPSAETLGNIDGVIAIDGTLFATDYLAGILWSYQPGQAPKNLSTLKQGSADIGTDGTLLFIPMMNEGEVIARSMR